MHIFRILGLSSIVAFISINASAGTFYVSKQGSNSNPGTSSSPWGTVSYALDQLSAGDTLNIRGGTYFEELTMSRSGTPTAPIVIQSYSGERAIIDSGTSDFRNIGNSDWVIHNAAIGEYKSVNSFSSSTPYAYIDGIPNYENERIVLVPYVSAASFRSTSDVYNGTDFYVGPGTFLDSDGKIHIRLSKTSELSYVESRSSEIFSIDNPDPRNFSIILSQASSTLTVSGAYLTFKNITFNQALRAISLEGSASFVTFEGITAWLGDRVIASEAGSGIHDIRIFNSKIYGDNPQWLFWSDMKSSPAPADLLRNTMIDLRNGAYNWEIAYNHIRGSGQDMIGTNTDERNIFVHHNRLENCGDDALEIEGTTDVGRVEVYENYVANCMVFSAPAQSTPSFTGPLLVYRNVVAFLRNPPVNRAVGINTWNGGGHYGYEHMFKHSSSSGNTSKNAHYYHNSLLMLNSAGKGLNITPTDPTNTLIANNLMMMVNGNVNDTYRTGSGQVVDGDLYWKFNSVDSESLLSSYNTVSGFSSATGLEQSGIGSVSKRGTNPLFETFSLNVVNQASSVWELLPTSERFGPADFLLSVSSPACNSGIDISSFVVTLPDTRNSQDIGAIPCGTSAVEFDVFPFNVEGPTLNPVPLDFKGGSGVNSGCGGCSASGIYSLPWMILFFLLMVMRVDRKKKINPIILIFGLGINSIHSLAIAADDEIHWTIKGQTAVTFDWRGSSSSIQYGTSAGSYPSSVAGQTPSPLPNSSAGPFWETPITGLNEGTLYYYKIGSVTGTFQTPPSRGSSDYWVAAEADLGSDQASFVYTQQRIGEDNANLTGDDRPRFVLAAGDLTYADQGTAADVGLHFNNVMSWSKTAAYMPAWGNHEDGGTDGRQNYEGRFDFPNSQNSPNAPSEGGPAEEWMWWDYGNVRFISYPEPFSGAWSDWETKADSIMSSAQSDASISFIVTFGHRPPFSSGADHGSESIADNMRTLRAKYSKYALNISGHSHHYERADWAQTDGVLQIVAGGGGYYLGGIDAIQPSWSAFRMNRLHHLKLHILSDRIEGYAICGPKGASGSAEENPCPRGGADKPGAVFDQWTILSSGAPPVIAPLPGSTPNSTGGGGGCIVFGGGLSTIGIFLCAGLLGLLFNRKNLPTRKEN